ncbi:MAG TPA: NAD(P)-dependent oxidoreductase [Novosphingobium sp.]|nr:NAD(P)-dependent oxidoreductase [Novosphingobium sp.]
MIESLPLFHKIAGRAVIVLGEDEAAQAKRRLVERAGGIVVGEDNAQARLAFVALDDPAEAIARLRARGVLVNVVDRPDLCDFTVPSILDRSPVLVAFGTGGASAGLAKALRLRFEVLVPASLGRLALALGQARAALRARWPDTGERRRALDAALGEGGALDPLGSDSAGRVDAWLADSSEAVPGGTVEIALRSPDPEDLTLREARLLGSADVLAHEPRVSPQVLDRARADAARVAIGLGDPAPDAAGLVVVLRC